MRYGFFVRGVEKGVGRLDRLDIVCGGARSARHLDLPRSRRPTSRRSLGPVNGSSGLAHVHRSWSGGALGGYRPYMADAIVGNFGAPPRRCAEAAPG